MKITGDMLVVLLRISGRGTMTRSALDDIRKWADQELEAILSQLRQWGLISTTPGAPDEGPYYVTDEGERVLLDGTSKKR